MTSDFIQEGAKHRVHTTRLYGNDSGTSSGPDKCGRMVTWTEMMVKNQAVGLLGTLLILGTAEKDQRYGYHVFTDLSHLKKLSFLISLFIYKIDND